ncbi:MAG: CapA family protein [Clostridiales bacterium]|nr:CapA family protein [Clostridiales bacterium]
MCGALLLIAALSAWRPLFGHPPPDDAVAAPVTASPAVSPAERAAAPTPQPATPAPLPTPSLRSATIRSVGDFLIHDELLEAAYDKAAKVYDFAPMLVHAVPYLEDADYTVANVDGVLKGGKADGFPRFSVPTALLDAIKGAGIDMLTLANNHTMDYGFQGLVATIENCERYGLDFVGAARSAEERDTPVVVAVNGIQVGFLNYAQHSNRKPPAAVRGYAMSMMAGANYARDIAALRTDGADVVVVYTHWGAEYQASPDRNQRNHAKKLAAAGADVIIGGHPHMVQPCAWIEATGAGGEARRALCMYSLGNFLAGKRTEARDTGVVFEFTIQETESGLFEIVSPRYMPTYTVKLKANSKYRVLACADWMDHPAPAMNRAEQAKVVRAWKYLNKLLGHKVAQPMQTQYAEQTGGETAAPDRGDGSDA